MSKSKLFCLSLLMLSFFVSPLLGAVKPKRVALISSSGVNNDFRSWGEYDGTLQSLAWQYDKFSNTEIDKFFAKSSDYDLVLTTSLWNYGDPQDMNGYIADWRAYLARGGIIILTDMAYPTMCDWLSSLDPELYIQYGDASRDLGEASQLDLSLSSPFLQVPNSISAFPYWAHFPRWGKGYQVWARTKGGTALGLCAFVEKGVLIVTTGFALSSQMLENLYTNALMLKNGVDIRWQKAPDVISPGTFQGEISLKNLRNEEVKLMLQLSLKDMTGKTLSQSGAQEVVLPPKGEKSLPVVLSCSERGNFSAVAQYKTEGMEEYQEVFHSFKVPPLVELSLNRPLFARSDRMKMTVRTAPKGGEKVRCQIDILDQSSRISWSRRWEAKGEDILNLPLRSFASGEYKLRLIAETRSEKASLEQGFKIDEKERPAVITEIGKKGELLINGEPFFPLGTYHIGSEDFLKAKEMGFNCITSPIYGSDQRELTADQLAWHDAAQRAGLWVITELSEYIRGGRRNFEEAKGIVSQLRLHPATIVHYVIDEPLGCGIGRELVVQFCDLVKDVDPEHITLVNEVPGAVSAYAGIGDVTGTDPYPIGAETLKSLAWVGESLETALKASKGKPVWGVIQAHRQPPANSQNRYPTPDELRCMSYLALNHGAKGLFFYAWGDVYQTESGIWESGFKFNPQLMVYFPQLLKELGKIGEEYLLGEMRRIPPQSLEPSSLDAVVIAYEGQEKLVAINPTSEEVDGRIGIEEISHHFLPFEVFIQELK